jgi:hypothetical protein
MGDVKVTNLPHNPIRLDRGIASLHRLAVRRALKFIQIAAIRVRSLSHQKTFLGISLSIYSRRQSNRI